MVAGLIAEGWTVIYGWLKLHDVASLPLAMCRRIRRGFCAGWRAGKGRVGHVMDREGRHVVLGEDCAWF